MKQMSDRVFTLANYQITNIDAPTFGSVGGRTINSATYFSKLCCQAIIFDFNFCISVLKPHSIKHFKLGNFLCFSLGQTYS
jgi:hypothetical protein